MSIFYIRKELYEKGGMTKERLLEFLDNYNIVIYYYEKNHRKKQIKKKKKYF